MPQQLDYARPEVKKRVPVLLILLSVTMYGFGVLVLLVQCVGAVSGLLLTHESSGNIPWLAILVGPVYAGVSMGTGLMVGAEVDWLHRAQLRGIAYAVVFFVITMIAFGISAMR